MKALKVFEKYLFYRYVTLFYWDKNYMSKQNGINVAYKQQSYRHNFSVQEVNIYTDLKQTSLLGKKQMLLQQHPQQFCM